MYGKCFCYLGYEGDDCSRVLDCPDECNLHGACHHGECFCEPGFSGEACETTIDCPNKCNGNGLCKHGQCFCDPGFGGKDCSIKLTCPRNCSSSGVCIQGICICLRGFTGADCATTIEGSKTDKLWHELQGLQTLAQLDGGVTTDQVQLEKLMHKPHSDILLEMIQLEEHDHQDWWNAHSSSRKLLFNSDQPSAMGLDNLGENRFTIMLAQQEVGTHPTVLPIAQESASQSAKNGTLWSTSRLSQSASKDATDKSLNQACLNQCSQQGSCKGGKCYCDPGYIGDDCGKSVECPNSCTNHGICQFGLCFCDPGWTSHDCSAVQGCLNDCSGHGTCLYGKCACTYLWEGKDCSKPVPEDVDANMSISKTAVFLAIAFAVGLVIGLAIKWAQDVNRNRKCKQILEEEKQHPFASG